MRLAECNAAETAARLRQVIAQYLKTPAIEVVEIESLQSPAILAEAKGKNCKFILQTSLGQKKGADFGKIFGLLAPMLGNIVPEPTHCQTLNRKTKSRLNTAWRW